MGWLLEVSSSFTLGELLVEVLARRYRCKNLFFYFEDSPLMHYTF